MRCSRDQSVDNVITFVDFSYSSFSSLCLFVCLFWAASHTQHTRRCCPLRRVSLRSADCLSVCLSVCVLVTSCARQTAEPRFRLETDSRGPGHVLQGVQIYVTWRIRWIDICTGAAMRSVASITVQYRPYSNVLSLLALQCIARCEMLLEICYTLSWSVCQSVCLSACLSVCPSVRPPVCWSHSQLSVSLAKTAQPIDIPFGL